MTDIYLNASSHGLPSAQTIARIRAHLDLELKLGALTAAKEVAGELADVKTQAEHLISATPGTLGLAATTFSTWFSIVAKLPMSGKRLLVAPHEWGENIAASQILAKNAGGRVEVLPELDLSNPDLAAWSEHIDEDVVAILTPYISSVSGLRYPVEAIGALPRPDNALLVVDAAQALGQIPIDASLLACDVLVATCRKWLRGPRGTALFWIAEPDKHGLFIEDIEPFDANVALRLGLGNAIAEATHQSMEAIEHRVQQLCHHAHARALNDGFVPLSDTLPASGACSIQFPAHRRKSLEHKLAEANIHIKWPNAKRDEPFSNAHKEGREVMRITPHIYNHSDQIDQLFDLMRSG